MGGGGGVPPSRQKAVIGVFERFPKSIMSNSLEPSRAKHLQEVARMIPLQRLLLETDAPYFPPSAASGALPEFIMMKKPLAK